ncbi:MAG: T9SS type A sorting domain-containing protein [Ignavibacteriaceae bacterium]|nr:T9SS type A sorting domain-containing protein [Ignavibacteriaceae bacterium]
MYTSMRFLFFMIIIAESMVLFPQYGGGTGTSGDPYLISTLDHLSALSGTTSDWNKHFKQTANIDASGTSSWEGGAGWSPIGNSTTNFTGSYNGQGYTISGLTLYRPITNGYFGFFGYISNATLQNIGLTGVSIAAKSVIGGLVGYVYLSNISNCYVTGSVGAEYDKVGGLIGHIYNGNIVECYSSASVSGGNSNSNGAYAGGFVGYNEAGAAFSRCYSTGSVTSYSYVGGFIGVHASNTIEDCYSRGNVSGKGGNSDGAGFVGVNAGTISRGYSTGSVSLTHPAGFAYSNFGTISNSFWDTQTSGQSSSAGGTGKFTSQMKLQSTFTDAGWSNTTWNMDTRNDGYPYLDWENPGGTPLPVELTSFTASVNDNNVVLNWETATEVNNYGFEIERVKSEELKVKNFTTLGFVPGAGNSNSPKSYSFADNDIENGTYLYRLKQLNTDGSFDYSNEISAVVSFIPDKFLLMQNYPNPFNGETIIKYQLPEDGFITIKLFNVLGNESGVIINEFKKAGPHTVIFRAGDLSSGVYYYRMSSGNISHTARMILIK